LQAIPLVKEGAKTIIELANLCEFVLKDRPFPLDAKTQGLLAEETRGRLSRLTTALTAASDWNVAVLEQLIRDFAQSEGVGIGKFGPALRGVLSGGSPAPDLASTLCALGKAESLERLKDALCSAA
jgi:glutamyl-tRNA synthetase